MKKKSIITRLFLLVGILLFLTLPVKSQTVYHNSGLWTQIFLEQNREGLDSLVVQGYLQKSGDGNKYFTILLDSSYYSGAEWHFLDFDTPLRCGGQLWAFTGEEALEPYLFYASEFEIKYNDLGVKSWTYVPYPEPFSNLENTDLGTFFNNIKLHKPKADREKKLKDKKDKKG